MIATVIVPALIAGGYWTWDYFRLKPSPWYIQDGDVLYFSPGPEFKLSREAVDLKRSQADTEAAARLNRP
jgi:hypothetical protein